MLVKGLTWYINKTTYSDNLIFALLKNPCYFCHKMGGFIVKFGILNIRNIGYPCRKTKLGWVIMI